MTTWTPLPVEGVQVRGQGRHEGLALARLHLRDHAAVQGDAADELHVEVPHVEHAAARLAHDREGLGEEVVEGLALGQPRPELRGLGRELGVGELAGGTAPARRCARDEGPIRFSSRSFRVPMILVRMVFSMRPS